MSRIDVTRAWKDAEYRNTLSEAEKAQLPQNPAGAIELSDTALESAVGALPNATAPVICTPECTNATHFCYTEWYGNTCRYCTYTQSCE